MGNHKTPRSKSTISSIAKIGESLGYDVRIEWEIPGTGPFPERIDLAFFVSQDATRPIFVVEVDSADGPASTSNAVKIFGKPTRNWVKPVFVFHIFLDAAERGNRRANIEGLLSTQNYRTYCFEFEKQDFLLDLIDLHLSIYNEVDIVRLAIELDDSNWSTVDHYSFLSRTKDCFTLSELARIALASQNMQSALSREVAHTPIARLIPGELSFAGHLFVWPLMYAFRAFLIPEDSASIFLEFRKWQQEPGEVIFHESYSCLGLSREFDMAISRLSPPIFCLVAILFSSDRNAARTLCEQLFARATNSNLREPWELFALLWCAIASIRVRCDDVAENAIARINRLGGLPASILADTPFCMNADDGEYGWEFFLSATPSSLITVDLIAKQLPRNQLDMSSAERLVAQIMIDDDLMMNINQRVLLVCPDS